MKKFTFKTENPTGVFKSFESKIHYIKIKKAIVGTIDDDFPHKIRLMVIKKNIWEDGNSNCEWKRVLLVKKSKSIKEAKDWLNNDIILKSITDRYNLFLDKR